MHACDSSSGSARVLAHIRSAHSAWAARLTVGESSCERHHVEPRRRFLPWPPRLVSATRWGAAEAEACASRARDQQAAWEGAHTPRRPRRSEASRQVIHGYTRRHRHTDTQAHAHTRARARTGLCLCSDVGSRGLPPLAPPPRVCVMKSAFPSLRRRLSAPSSRASTPPTPAAPARWVVRRLRRCCAMSRRSGGGSLPRAPGVGRRQRAGGEEAALFRAPLRCTRRWAEMAPPPLCAL